MFLFSPLRLMALMAVKGLLLKWELMYIAEYLLKMGEEEGFEAHDRY